MNPKEWMTIPILPCISIDETMMFWKSLGFEQTYYQNRPYQYGVVQRGDYSLHFSRIKGLKPEEVYSTCLIMVTDIEAVYDSFIGNFRDSIGKIPRTGFPRISRMKPGQTRFTLTDPSGNSIIFIKFGEEDPDTSDKTTESDLTRLQKAIANAIQFRDFKTDDIGAAKILDVALEHVEGERPVDIAQALLIRIELAEPAEDRARIEACYAQLKKIQLTTDEIETIQKKVSMSDEMMRFFAPPTDDGVCPK